MPTIDFHVHWWPPAFLEYLEKSETPSESLPPLHVITAPPVADLEMRAKQLDGAEIDVAVLSNMAQPDATVHPELAQINNDGLAEIVSDRFRFLASLPLPLVDETVAEIGRISEVTGCDGFILPTHFQSQPLDDEAFEPILAALNERKAIVLLHPYAFRAEGALAQWAMDWTLGAPFETTIVSTRLAASGRLDQFPDIRWILAHAGGTLPMLWQRMDKQFATMGERMLGVSEKPSSYAKRFTYDTASNSPDTLALAALEQGADSLILGTDFPFVDARDLGAAVRTVRACPALDDDQAAAVLSGVALDR